MTTPSTLPIIPGPPRLAAAFGVIAGYLALQVAIGGVLGFGVTALLRWDGHAAGGLARHPDLRLGLVLLTLVGCVGITLAWVHRLWPTLWRQPRPPGLGWCLPRTAQAFAPAVFMGLAMPFAGGALTWLLAHGSPVMQGIRVLGNAASPGMRGLLALGAVVLAPLVEELLFRGLLLSALRRHARPSLAVTGSALAFALMHVPDLGWTLIAVPQLMLLGVVLAWLRLRSGSLAPAMLAHALNNLCAALVWFFVRS